MFSELLTELTPGQEDPEDRRLLLDVSATCREMQVDNEDLLLYPLQPVPQSRVLELVGVVQHRELTASLLEINDQMNNQLLRSNHCFPSYSKSTSHQGLRGTKTTWRLSAPRLRVLARATRLSPWMRF